MDGEKERELQEVKRELQRALWIVEAERRRLRAATEPDESEDPLNIWWVRLLFHVLVIFTALAIGRL